MTESHLTSLLLDTQKYLKSLESLEFLEPPKWFEEQLRWCHELADRLQIALAPHKRLPPELVSEILYHVIPHDFFVRISPFPLDTDRQQSGASITRLPWILGHICSSWRKVALTEPRLWTRIRIEEPVFRSRTMLDAVLQRSGNKPLNLVLSTFNSLYVVADVILPHASRIIQMSLNGSKEDITVLFYCFRPSVRSLLELTIGISPRSDGYEAEAPIGVNYFFDGCPLLRHFTLEASLDLLSPEDIDFVASRLTTIDIRSVPSPADALNILRLGTNLVDCTLLTIEEGESDARTLGTHISHPRLERLTIGPDTFRIYKTTLRHLTLPRLTELIIMDWGRRSQKRTPRSNSAFIAFLNRSACRLTRIDLGAVEDLDMVLTPLQHSLECLDAPYSTLRMTTMQRLINRDIVLPKLYIIRFCVLHAEIEEFFKALAAIWKLQSEVLPQDEELDWDNCLCDIDVDVVVESHEDLDGLGLVLQGRLTELVQEVVGFDVHAKISCIRPQRYWRA
jgi:hypothetical protein